MRRILLLVVSALALAIAVPVAASAHGKETNHGRQTNQGHHRHPQKAKRVRVVHLHGSAKVDPAGPAGRGDAGTVASYDATTGVLAITLANGSTVSGNVTGHTRIVSVPAPKAASHRGGRGDDHPADDQGADDHGKHGKTGTSALVAGAVVRQAILKISPAGSVFKLVMLVEQPETTPAP